MFSFFEGYERQLKEGLLPLVVRTAFFGSFLFITLDRTFDFSCLILFMDFAHLWRCVIYEKQFRAQFLHADLKFKMADPTEEKTNKYKNKQNKTVQYKSKLNKLLTYCRDPH